MYPYAVTFSSTIVCRSNTMVLKSKTPLETFVGQTKTKTPYGASQKLIELFATMI